MGGGPGQQKLLAAEEQAVRARESVSTFGMSVCLSCMKCSFGRQAWGLLARRTQRGSAWGWPGGAAAGAQRRRSPVDVAKRSDVILRHSPAHSDLPGIHAAALGLQRAAAGPAAAAAAGRAAAGARAGTRVGGAGPGAGARQRRGQRGQALAAAQGVAWGEVRLG